MPIARHLVTTLTMLSHSEERSWGSERVRRPREEGRREVEMVDEDKWRWEEKESESRRRKQREEEDNAIRQKMNNIVRMVKRLKGKKLNKRA